MKAIIESAFPVCTENDCVIEYTDGILHIYDPKDAKCIVTYNQELSHFIISNPTAKSLTFTAIDHCIWGEEQRKCDFSITDNITFAFIEIKETRKRYPSHKVSAKEQLETTIKEFYAVLDMTHLHRKAIIGWRFKKTYPAATTKMQSAKVHFLDTYQVDLMEGNSFEF